MFTFMKTDVVKHIAFVTTAMVLLEATSKKNVTFHRKETLHLVLYHEWTSHSFLVMVNLQYIPVISIMNPTCRFILSSLISLLQSGTL